MGGACEKCETESVINLTDKCVARLTKEEKVKKCGKKYAKGKLKDDEWMKKLKCLDDIHSHENGLSPQALDCLLRKVEAQVDPVSPLLCPVRELLVCLQNQENCMIKCKKIMDDFIDCVDTQRINKIKDKIEIEKKLKQEQEKKEKEKKDKQQNEVAEQ